jgi:hypothetical protein
VEEAAKHLIVAGAFLLTALNLANMTVLMNGRRGAVSGVLRAAVVGGAIALGFLVVSGHLWNILKPRPWDYPPLYIAARAAANGNSAYSPESLRTIHDELAEEVDLPLIYIKTVKTPFNPYLPVTLLVTAPLGLLGYRASLAIHVVIHTTFFVCGVLLLRSLCADVGRRIGLPAALALGLCYPPVIAAFSLAQNVFGAFFFVTLWLWLAERNRIMCGVALAAAFPFKHLVLTVGALSALVARVSSAIAFSITVAAMCVTAVIFFGPSSFSDYARWGTTVPFYHYVEAVTQSLLAAMYRLVGYTPDAWAGANFAFYPPFLLVAGILVAISAGVIAWSPNDAASRQLKRALVIVIALLVYPGTLHNTMVLMLPVFFVVIALRDDIPVSEGWLFGFVLVEYLVTSLRPGGTWWQYGGFLGMVVAWVFLCVLLIRMTVLKRSAASSGDSGSFDATDPILRFR